MGEVYRATDTHLGRDVAIKVLPAEVAQDPERLARFDREAHLLATLNHPNVAHVYGFESATLEDGSLAHFLAMELVEGEDLSERLKRGAIPVDEALDIAKQIAEALEEPHDKGIIHRDLKPANVKITSDGKVKVLDFGLAKAYAGESAGPGADLSQSPTLAHTGTQAGLLLGTAAYMSPEQARGKPVDKRSDIWAFGVVLYEMLAGRQLFAGETVSDVLAGVLKTEVDLGALPDATPPGLRQLLRRCLDRQPRSRLHDIADARILIEDALAGRDDAGPTPGRRWKSAASWSAGALAAGLALGQLAPRWLEPEGSTGSPISFERLTFRPGHFVNARFAPDGQTVFLAADWDRQEREVFQVRPKAGELAIGLRGAELLSVSRSGELAVLLPRFETGNPYVQSGTLAVVSASGGTPRELADGVMGADWSPDGQSLAVLRYAERHWQLEYPLGKVLYASPTPLYWLRVSPKGNEVAFFEWDAEDRCSVVVIDASGARQVWSSGWADWWNLAWSPGGDEIWFGAAHGGAAAILSAVDRQGRLRTLLAAPGAVEIHDVSADGAVLVAQFKMRRQTLGGRADAASEVNLTWLEDTWVAGLSTDGSTALLGVTSEREPGVDAIYLRALDGSPPVRLGPGKPQELSRDGRWVLAIRGDSVVALPTAAGEERVLGTGLSNLIAARFMPDPAQVLALTREPAGTHSLRVLGTGESGARTVAESLELRPTAARGTRLLSPVSPDGRLVAAPMADGVIALLSLDGGPVRSVPGTGPNDLPIQWAADGRLFVLDPSAVPGRIYIVDVASGRRETWREITILDPVGVAGVGQAAVTPDAKAYAYSYQQLRSDLYLLKGLR